MDLQFIELQIGFSIQISMFICQNLFDGFWYDQFVCLQSISLKLSNFIICKIRIINKVFLQIDRSLIAYGIFFCYFASFIKHFGAYQFLSNSLFIGLSWVIMCCLVIFQGGITSMLDQFIYLSFLCYLHWFVCFIF
jgi:hypothetical protein